ncbi:MAG: dTMP kinase [Kiritimatiellae bacterium]|nr:dTMP kinase [Kiritimatiellia bacterium]
MARGKFITLEGGEAAGKSTQIARIKAALEARGIETVVTREPGGTRLAELIRGLLKDEYEDAPCDRAELLLFLAARAQLVKNVIKPALDAGKWVVSDRFSDSTFAYQGYGRGLPLDAIETANSFACDGLKPDITFWLDVSPETALKRRLGREAATHTGADRFEREQAAFHERLRAGFAALHAAEPGRIARIDANAAQDDVWEEIWTHLKPILS